MSRSKTVKKDHAPHQYLGVMVSSSFRDLHRLRADFLRIIRNQRLAAVGMERDAALPIDTVESSLRMVREAAAYAGVIGRRYGHIPKTRRRNPKNLSLTELEFNEALRLRRPILLFLMGERYRQAYKNEEPSSSQRKLKAFRERAKLMGRGSKLHRVYATFDSPKQFVEQAAQSISELRGHLEQRSATEADRGAAPSRVSRRPSGNAALVKASPRRQSATPSIRFASVFDLDEVSVVNVRLFHEKHPKANVVIAWHERLIGMRAKVAELVDRIQNQSDPRSVFPSRIPDNLGKWVQDAHEAMEDADKIISSAHRGVESILRGTRDHFHSRPDVAIKNFARLCVLAAGRQLADVLTQSGHDTGLSDWRPYQNADTRGVQLRRLFGCKEPVWSVQLLGVSNFEFDVGQSFHGPRSNILEYMANDEAPIVSRWFLEWIVPQLELFRVIKGKFAAVTYDERVTTTGKLFDERAKEVTSHPSDDANP